MDTLFQNSYLSKFRTEAKEITQARVYTDRIWEWTGKRKGTYGAIRKAINEGGKEIGRRFIKYVIEAGINPPDRYKYFHKVLQNNKTQFK